jgi:hypothetical protein
MRTMFRFLFGLLLPALLLVSCEQEAIDPLSGIYTSPEQYDFSVLSSQNRVKEGNLYRFTLNLTDDAANTLNMKLVANDYILPSSDFTPSTKNAKNTYLTGSNGSTCNGKAIIGGTVSVALQDSNYTLNGILYLADETVVKMQAAFTFNFLPDPYQPSYTYSDETETPALGGAQGNVPIEGSTKHKLSIYADDELCAFLEVVAEAGAPSLSGTYTIKDGLDAIGQIGNGYYLDWSWWGGAGVLEGGSYYLDAGEKFFIREGEGNISISDNLGALNITGNNLPILDVPTLISSMGATWANLAKMGNFTFENVTPVN